MLKNYIVFLIEGEDKDKDKDKDKDEFVQPFLQPLSQPFLEPPKRKRGRPRKTTTSIEGTEVKDKTSVPVKPDVSFEPVSPSPEVEPASVEPSSASPELSLEPNVPFEPEFPDVQEDQEAKKMKEQPEQKEEQKDEDEMVESASPSPEVESVSPDVSFEPVSPSPEVEPASVEPLIGPDVEVQDQLKDEKQKSQLDHEYQRVESASLSPELEPVSPDVESHVSNLKSNMSSLSSLNVGELVDLDEDEVDLISDFWEKLQSKNKPDNEKSLSEQSPLYRFMARWHPPSGEYKPKDVSNLETIFQRLTSDYVFQLERGSKTGKLHYQMFFKLKEKKRSKQLEKEKEKEILCNQKSNKGKALLYFFEVKQIPNKGLFSIYLDFQFI
jgi:hypothetical protein